MWSRQWIFMVYAAISWDLYLCLLLLFLCDILSENIFSAHRRYFSEDNETRKKGITVHKHFVCIYVLWCPVVCVCRKVWPKRGPSINPRRSSIFSSHVHELQRKYVLLVVSLHGTYYIRAPNLTLLLVEKKHIKSLDDDQMVSLLVSSAPRKVDWEKVSRKMSNERRRLGIVVYMCI